MFLSITSPQVYWLCLDCVIRGFNNIETTLSRWCKVMGWKICR